MAAFLPVDERRTRISYYTSFQGGVRLQLLLQAVTAVYIIIHKRGGGFRKYSMAVFGRNRMFLHQGGEI